MKISEVKGCVEILINSGLIPKLNPWNKYEYSEKRIHTELDNLTKRFSQKYIDAFIGVYMLKTISMTTLDNITRRQILCIRTKIHDFNWVSWKYVLTNSSNRSIKTFFGLFDDSEDPLVLFIHNQGWSDDSVHDVYMKAIISYVYDEGNRETLIKIIQIVLQLMCVSIFGEDIVIDTTRSKQIVTKESYPWNLLHDIGDLKTWDCFDIKDDIRDEFTELIYDGLSLRPREAECIKLRYIDLLSFQAIGDRIGVSLSRVGQITSRALRKLRHPTRIKVVRRLVWKHSYDISKQAFVELERDGRIFESRDLPSLDVLNHIKSNKDICKYEDLVSIIRENPVYMKCFRDGNFIGELDRLCAFDKSNNPISDGYDPKVLELTLEDLDLSIRAFNCLRRAGVQTVSDIVSLTEEKLMHVRNLGKKSYDEIIGIIEKLGLSLGCLDTDDETHE